MNLEELLAKHGVEFRRAGEHHHAHQGWLNFDCPYCSPDSRRFRMGVNLRSLRLNCWVCGQHPTLEALSKLLELPVLRLRGVLAGFAPVLPSDERLRGKQAVSLPHGRGLLLPQHRAYLSKRGFDPDTLVQLWGIEGIGLAPRLRWRIFIPAYLEDKVVSWTTRSISDTVASRYVSAKVSEEAVSLKEILYGEQYCRHAVILNEGPLDAWVIGPGAVATCGVGYSRKQLLLASKYPVRVVCFDNERDAQRRAAKLCGELSLFPGETYNVTFETGKDASRASKHEIKELRKRFLE